MTIRRATTADAAAAATLIAASLAEYGVTFEPDGRDADVALFGAREDHDDFVAEHRGDVVGVVSLGPHGHEGWGWISKLFVASGVRCQGLGRALLETAHEAARARGYSVVGLRTRLVFERAVRLYARSGYEASAPSGGEIVCYRRF